MLLAPYDTIRIWHYFFNYYEGGAIVIGTISGMPGSTLMREAFLDINYLSSGRNGIPIFASRTITTMSMITSLDDRNGER